MGRKLLAICDSEPIYARKLMEQICLDEASKLHVRTFTDAGQLFQYSKKHEIDLLLMEECYSKELRYKIPARKRFLLVHDTVDERILQNLEEETVILKYQPAEDILRQLMKSVRESEVKSAQDNIREKHAEDKRTKSGNARVIGVYSPIHRIGKTRFSLELAEQLSRDSTVLYLNLEEYSGLEYCVPIQEREHLGDLLYYSRQDPDAFGFRLTGMVSQLGGVDYVQPAPVTRDIRDVRGQEWKELLEQIREKSIYDTIILDLGDSIQGLFEILRLCETVYTPYIADDGAQAKLKQYTENLRRLEYEDVIEHTVQKEMVSV